MHEIHKTVRNMYAVSTSPSRTKKQGQDGTFFCFCASVSSAVRLTLPLFLRYLLFGGKVEMRLMAHLSGDPDLRKVFMDGGDVFQRIAAALKGKKAVDVTDEERGQVCASCVSFQRFCFCASC